jgi:hypothetical protein
MISNDDSYEFYSLNQNDETKSTFEEKTPD